MRLFKATLILMLLLTLSIFPPTVAHAKTNERPFNILVLNSYHFTYPWTFNQNTGINDRLTEAFPDAVIYTEFLDWKRFPDDTLIQDLNQIFTLKYQSTPIDLILTTDDKALIYALSSREKIFSNAPIAFSGIIELSANEIIGNQKNVTGVYEQMDPEGTLHLLDLLQPDIADIYLVHDLSESGIRTSENVLASIAAHEVTKQYHVFDLSNLSFDELLSRTKNLPKTSIVFMISYNASTDGRIEKPEIFGRLLSESSSVPIYTIDEFLLGNGALGGTFLSGVLQGLQLGELGISILNGTPADSIPRVSKATVYSAVDEQLLERFKLKKDILSSDIQIINEEFSFYETYKTTVWITSSIIITLLVLISLLIVNIQKRRQNELDLLSSRDELQDLYEQVQSSEEELLAQNEELEAYQDQLKHEAHYDSLTNLPNRLYLTLFGQDLFETCRQHSSKLVLFFIDLNNFRYVNNTHGHSFGDKLLQNIAMRLSNIPSHTLSVRLGGDEFVVLVEVDSENSSPSIKDIITGFRQLFLLPFQVNTVSVPITASIGYSIYPDDGVTMGQLIAQADMAMYETKKDKKSYAKRFDTTIQSKYEQAFSIISSLKQAYENKEFILHYQPQIDLASDTIVGFEALLRWFSPAFGNVPPSKFIPLAESCGFIKTLGACVIKNALEFVQQMQDEITTHFKVSVNVSVVQLFEDDFIDTVKKYLQKYLLIHHSYNLRLLNLL